MQLFIRSLLLLFIIFPATVTCRAEEYDPNRYGVMVIGSNSHHMPETIQAARIAAFASFDYDKIWRHWAPDNLRWKLELNTGLTTTPEVRSLTSLVMIAQLYLTDQNMGKNRIRPFIEGGIGGGYADFQIEGQGSRWMFNPQFGAGTDFTLGSSDFFFIIRQDHYSNGGLSDDNRGWNFLSCYLGIYF